MEPKKQPNLSQSTNCFALLKQSREMSENLLGDNVLLKLCFHQLIQNSRRQSDLYLSMSCQTPACLLSSGVAYRQLQSFDRIHRSHILLSLGILLQCFFTIIEAIFAVLEKGTTNAAISLLTNWLREVLTPFFGCLKYQKVSILKVSLFNRASLSCACHPVVGSCSIGIIK